MSNTSVTGTPSWQRAWVRSISAKSCGTLTWIAREQAGDFRRLSGALARNALGGTVQRLVTEAGAVLDLQLEAADGAEAVDRRRREHGDERLLDGGDTCRSGSCRDRRAAEHRRLALVERFQRRRTRCRHSSELAKPLIDRPGTPPRSRRLAASARCRSCGGSLPRCDQAVAPSGNCAKPTRYCLSWPGTKPPGTDLNKLPGDADQRQIEADHHGLARNRAA